MTVKAAPFRVAIACAGGAVASYQEFAAREEAVAFLRGVLIGYWWSPATLPRRPVPMHEARATLWYDGVVLLDAGLQTLGIAELEAVSTPAPVEPADAPACDIAPARRPYARRVRVEPARRPGIPEFGDA